MSPIPKARLFALLNITKADAIIACWDAKYHYEFWRANNCDSARGPR